MKQTLLRITCISLLFCTQIGLVFSAEIIVGVKAGDWMEYEVTTTGNVPQEHNLTRAKITVTRVEGKKIHINITSIYTNSNQETTQATLNLQTGEILDSFIIPANLTTGDSFPEIIQGSITIQDTTQKTIAGASRTTVTADTPQTNFYWDQQTGFLVEANSTFTDFTMYTTAQKTNIWQTQIIQLYSTTLAILLILTIAIIIAIIWLIKKEKLTTKKSN